MIGPLPIVFIGFIATSVLAPMFERVLNIG
jgi:ABC-type uncharacterized transport system permease subunit